MFLQLRNERAFGFDYERNSFCYVTDTKRIAEINRRFVLEMEIECANQKLESLIGDRDREKVKRQNEIAQREKTRSFWNITFPFCFVVGLTFPHARECVSEQASKRVNAVERASKVSSAEQVNE